MSHAFRQGKGVSFDYRPKPLEELTHYPEEQPQSLEWQAAVRFLTGQGEVLTPELRKFLRCNMISEVTIERLIEAQRSGARMGANVPPHRRALSHIVDHPRFEWHPRTADASDPVHAQGTSELTPTHSAQDEQAPCKPQYPPMEQALADSMVDGKTLQASVALPQLEFRVPKCEWPLRNYKRTSRNTG